MQDLALPAATRRAEAARDSIRAWYQALRQPPDVAGGVRNATLSIVVGHVGDRPEGPSAGCDRTSHGCVGVLDVEIVRSTRWLEGSPRLADHDRGIAKPYMSVAHDALGRGEYVQDLAAKALNEESQIGSRIRREDVRKHPCEPRWDVHVDSLKSMPSVRLRGFYLSPWVSAHGRLSPVATLLPNSLAMFLLVPLRFQRQRYIFLGKRAVEYRPEFRTGKKVLGG